MNDTTLDSTDSETDSLEVLQQRFGDNYRTFAVLTIALGTIATVLSSTNINVAIPSIMGAFGVGQDVVQWVSTGYLAAATVTMLSTAWMIEAFGMRSTFIGGIIVFVLSSILGALSPSIEISILSRVIQGASSGIFMPMSMFLMSRIFPPNKQGIAMGIFGIIVIMAPAFGPYLGGLIIDHAGWRYVFYMPLPLAAIAFILALLFLPEREAQGDRPPFDWLSVILLSSAISLLLLGFSKGQMKGWSSNYTLSCFSMALSSAALFIHRQKHLTKPLLNLAMFKYSAFNASAIITIIFGAGLHSTFYTVPLFLQSIQGLSATSAGMSLLPGGLVLAIVFPISGKLSDKFPHWILIVSGLLILMYSSWLMIDSDRQTYLWLFVYWVTLGRIGFGLIMPALSSATFSAVPKHMASQASGVSNFLRQLGGALGVNLTSVYLDWQTAFYTVHLNSTQHMGNPQTVEFFSKIMPYFQQAGINEVQQKLLAFHSLGKEIYRQSLTLAFQDTFLVTSVIFILALIPTAYLMYKNKVYPLVARN